MLYYLRKLPNSQICRYGKNPYAVAATILYMAGIKTNADLTQKDIVQISGITGITIRNRMQDYQKYVKLS